MMTGTPIQIGGAGLLALLWLFTPPTPGGAHAGRCRARRGSLAGHLLVATPELDDPNFRHTIIYMIQDDSSGAMGLVVNRVLGKGPAAELLKGLGLDANPKASGEIEVHYGGPVERGRGFVLHSPEYHGEDTVVLSDLAAVTSSPDILEDLAAGKGPRAEPVRARLCRLGARSAGVRDRRRRLGRDRCRRGAAVRQAGGLEMAARARPRGHRALSARRRRDTRRIRRA